MGRQASCRRKQAGTGKEKEPHTAGEVLGPSEDRPMSVLAQPVSRQRWDLVKNGAGVQAR